MSVLDPISVILVTAGSRGNALLFRYPFCAESNEEIDGTKDDNESACSLENNIDPRLRSSSFIKKGCLNYSDKTLANILTPREKLCGKKFELRIDDVLFVGHPTLVTSEAQNQRYEAQNKVEGITIKLFNIVFALQADVELSVCECYHDLAQKISIALKHEELRCSYFSTERQTMLAIHDEVSELPEASAVSPFHLILPKSTLAKDLCDAFDSVCKTGTVSLKINNWVAVSFCLPHKVHNISSEMIVKPEAVQACLSAMRPYHTILLLVDESLLLSLLPDDCSPDLVRFVKMATPLKRLYQQEDQKFNVKGFQSFQTLSQDTDIPLSLIFSIAAHLVLWGKARIIYPLCESNVYVVSPVASIRLDSSIAEQFAKVYPGMSLHEHLAQFSLPTPLGEQANPLWLPQQKTEQVQRVIWMLKHQLLIQLHTYVYLIPTTQSDTVQDSSFTRQSSVKGKRDILDGQEKRQAADTTSPFESQNLAELSELERRSVYQIDAANDPEDIKLFTRLCRYFRGSHHFEEIMYYENLRRNQILTVLEKFRKVLFICQHEDPATVYHTTSE